MSKRSILENLETVCPFPKVLKDHETINGCEHFDVKTGHIRGDYRRI